MEDAMLVPLSQEDKAKPWREIDWDQALGVEAQAQKYIVGHLPDDLGTFGMIIGSDGSRKSWLALHAAIAVAGGKPVAGGLWPAPQPGRTVYFTSEDSANEMHRRVQRIARLPGNEWMLTEGGLRNLSVVPLNADDLGLTLVGQHLAAADLERGIEAERSDVDEIILQCVGARLIIIDPQADALNASENDDIAAKKLVEALRKISRHTGAGVLMVRHQSKNAMISGDTRNQTARGSSKVPAAARWCITIQPLGGDEAEKLGIPDRERWTVVHEAKSSYAMVDEDRALYHHPFLVDESGRETGGVPLAKDLTESAVKKSTKNGSGKKPKGNLDAIFGGEDNDDGGVW